MKKRTDTCKSQHFWHQSLKTPTKLDQKVVLVWGIEKRKRNWTNKKNVANSCSRSHFFELMNHLSYIVIDCKISRCIQNMKWGNPNKKKTEWGCGIKFVQATLSKTIHQLKALLLRSWAWLNFEAGHAQFVLKISFRKMGVANFRIDPRPVLSNIRAFQRCIICRMKQTWAKIDICKQLLPLTSPIEKRKWFINTLSICKMCKQINLRMINKSKTLQLG